MSSDVLLGQYPKQQCVRDRNLSSLLRWATGTLAMEIPTAKPDETFVRNRIVAGQIPGQADSFVQQTMSWFLMDPGTTARIHDYLNPFGQEDVEDQLSNQNAAIIAAFMPKFSLMISDEQVQQWYTEHGFT